MQKLIWYSVRMCSAAAVMCVEMRRGVAAVIYELTHRSQVWIRPEYTVTHYSCSHLTYLNNNTVEHTRV